MVMDRLEGGHTGRARASDVQGHATVLGMIKHCRPHQIDWGEAREFAVWLLVPTRSIGGEILTVVMAKFCLGEAREVFVR